KGSRESCRPTVSQSAATWSASSARDSVAPSAAGDRVLRPVLLGGDAVVAGAADDRVAPVAAVEEIRASEPVEAVRSTQPGQDVGSGSPDEPVRPGRALDRHRLRSAAERERTEAGGSDGQALPRPTPPTRLWHPSLTLRAAP